MCMKFAPVLLGLGIALTACGSDIEKMSETETKPPEYFMSYKVNGKKITLNEARVISVKNDVRYKIAGASNIQGDVNVVVIQHNNGPPTKGKFSTNEGSLVFTLGHEDGEFTTFYMANLSLGSGRFSISEITDIYAKGTFSFIAVESSEEGSKRNYNVTEGRFKARISEPY